MSLEFLESRAVILFGGSGPESLVSVASATNIATHLPCAALWFWHSDGRVAIISRDALEEHLNPFENPFIPTSTPFSHSIQDAIRRASHEGLILLLALHGGEGEDGTFAAQCEALGVPFTGSNSVASRLAFDKMKAKEIVSSAGVRTLPSIPLSPEQTSLETKAIEWLRESTCVVAKPVRDGSSHGLHFLRSLEALNAFVSSTREVEYLIEPLANGREATVGVFDDGKCVRALTPVEIRLPDGAQFDYTRKYLDARVQELCPPTLTPDMVRKLKDFAIAAHNAIGAEGYSRTDYIVTESAGPVFLEINTLPGLTSSSLFPRELTVEGILLRDFLLRQVELALHRVSHRLRMI